MKHNHISIVIASLLLATSSFAATSNPPANLKGEVAPCQTLTLNDGLYIGADFGYDSYRVKDDVSYVTPVVTAPFEPVYMNNKLSVNGVVGGGFIGYGKYFDNFYNTYLGLELFGNWSSAEQSYNQAAFTPLFVDVPPAAPGTFLINQGLQTNIKTKYNFGISLLPGFKVSDIALVYVRLGYNWAHFRVNQTITNTATFLDTLGTVIPSGSELLTSSTTNTSHGFNYGVGLEAALMPNMSARIEATHTTYSSFSLNGAGNSIHPSDTQAMISVVYRPMWA